ncbi:MAG TPA: hypothetical protein VIM94_03260 [Salegentibacter sp.]|uniref:hypothetical protein n=1 Tax=Salegentibacter sp. TaxID=1903072 RepID=UPI002F936911
MDKDKKSFGCLNFILIIICFGVSAAIFSPTVPYIGFLAYPLIIIGGIVLGKLIEPIFISQDK